MTDYKDSKTWASLATPDPEYEAAARAIGGAPDLGLFPDIPAMRNFLEQSKAGADDAYGPIPGVKEEDRQIAVRDGHKITVRVHYPETKPAGGSPLSIIYHGGGWCIGGLVDEETLCRLMVNKFGMVVVNVDYRLGPEYKFPTAQYDCYDATKWAADNASSLGADPSKGFIIGGTSAGGQITAVVSHLWRDDKLTPKITGCHLMIPAICHTDFIPQEYSKDTVSWQQLEFAPILSHAACNLFLKNFIPTVADRGEPLFSPLLFKTGHKELPAQYFQICGMDPLRDEALVYERRLREEDGVKTKVDLYPGQPHGFWSIFPQMKASTKFVEDSVAGVKWLLEQD